MNSYSNLTKSRSIFLLYSISKLAFWFSVIFSLVLSSVLFYAAFGGDVPLTVKVESNGAIYEKEYLHSPTEKLEKEVLRSSSSPFQKLALKRQAFHEAPLLEKSVVLCSTLLLLFLTVLITYYAKEFMRAIDKGEYFERETMNKLRVISFLLLSAWCLKLTSSLVLKLLLKNIEVNPVTKFHISVNFPSVNLLVFSLMIWVLSYIFLQGVKLKEENELTV